MADMKSDNVVGNSPGGMEMEASSQGEKANNNIVETLLRLLPMALCLSALLLMFKNSQSNDFGSVSYSDLAAFRFLPLSSSLIHFNYCKLLFFVRFGYI